MEKTVMRVTQLHEDNFLTIFWDENLRVIGVEWKDTTSSMTDANFKQELTMFADYVERKAARGILVDVSQFRYTTGPALQEWRVKNISSRYSAAGVERFAFLLANGSPIPPMMNQSSPGESFATRAFTDLDEAKNWLIGAGQQQSAAD
jgi:hypothetical protein